MKPNQIKIGFCIVFLTDREYEKKIEEVKRVISDIEEERGCIFFSLQ